MTSELEENGFEKWPPIIEDSVRTGQDSAFKELSHPQPDYSAIINDQISRQARFLYGTPPTGIFEPVIATRATRLEAVGRIASQFSPFEQVDRDKERLTLARSRTNTMLIKATEDGLTPKDIYANTQTSIGRIYAWLVQDNNPLYQILERVRSSRSVIEPKEADLLVIDSIQLLARNIVPDTYIVSGQLVVSEVVQLPDPNPGDEPDPDDLNGSSAA